MLIPPTAKAKGFLSTIFMKKSNLNLVMYLVSEKDEKKAQSILEKHTIDNLPYIELKYMTDAVKGIVRDKAYCEVGIYLRELEERVKLYGGFYDAYHSMEG